MAINISGSFVDDTTPMTGNLDGVPHFGIQGPPGPQGPEGGHYIPHIEQTGDNELLFEFSPSSPDMPAVDPVHVVLPAAPDSGGNVDLTGYATEQFVRDGYQPKGDYLASSALPTAINTALAQAKASGEFDGKDGVDGVDGKDGYTPVKGKDYFDGKDGKDGKDGVDGQPGKDGEDGYTPVKGVDYFDGEPGAPGKTPVKGTDYYTEADKTEMVNAVLSALPTWTGGSY